MDVKNLTTEEFIEVRNNLEKALSVIEKSRVELYNGSYSQTITKQPLDSIAKNIALRITNVVDNINTIVESRRRDEYND